MSDALEEFLEFRGRDGAREDCLVPGAKVVESVLCIPVAIVVAVLEEVDVGLQGEGGRPRI